MSTLTRRTFVGGVSLSAAALGSTDIVRLPRKVQVAVLGLDGHVAEIVNPLPRLPDVEVTAFSDPDPKAAARFVKNPRVAAARHYTSYRQMLEREKLDMVAICNNNGERAEAILACLKRHLHVIAEKPLAIEKPDLERVKEAVKVSGVRLSMLLPMRYDPPYLALKEIVDSGEIGEVIQIAAQKSYKAGARPAWYTHRETYGGTIPWIGIHMVDLMLHTSGRDFTDAVSFQAHIGFPELGDMENVTATLFRLDNGGAGTLRMDYLRPSTAPTHGDDRLRLAGTKGIAEYTEAAGVTVISAGSAPRVIKKLPEPRSVFLEYLESVYLGKPETLTLPEIYRSNEIVLAARASAELHSIVKL